MSTLNRRALLAYLIVCVAWGSTYIAIRVAVRSLPPFVMAGTRFLIAGALLAGYVYWKRLPWPDGSRGVAYVAGCGVLFFLLGNGLVVWALQFMPSGTTSIFVVAVGIWTAVFDALVPGGPGRVTRRVGVGLAMAFVGSLLLVGTNATQIIHADWRGPLALTIASMAWAMGTVLMKRRPSPANPFANATVQMLAGGASLLLAGLLFGEGTNVTPTTEGVVAFVYLVIFGSLAGFGAYAYALHYMSPTAMGTYAYVNPVVAVIMGRVLLGEPISPRVIGAMALMIGAAVLVQFGDRLARSPGSQRAVEQT
ncbi:MAG: EamA family transporter [Vicinamibacteraceae bacterium]